MAALPEVAAASDSAVDGRPGRIDPAPRPAGGAHGTQDQWWQVGEFEPAIVSVGCTRCVRHDGGRSADPAQRRM